MKKERKLLAVILVICMVFAFTACGGNEQSDADVMKTAAENMEGLKSMTADTTMEMVMTMDGETLGMTTEMTQKVINDPITMEIVMNMIIDMAGEQQSVESISYGEVDGDNLVMYSQMDGEWYKTVQPGMEAITQYDNTAAMETYLKAIQNFKKTGTEDVNGISADKYEGVIGEDYFKTVLDESGVGDQFGLGDADDATLTELFEGVGDLPITIWIDGSKVMPVKYEFDMTDMMNAMMSNLGAEEEGFSIDKVYMTMVITGYDNVESIDIPQEARDAEELELAE